uniref:Uncharacterized protein n=1 Tax=Micrurus paraensis TaxID=1970185 RepID=A0A2D4L0C0_9SAUR
MMIVVLLLTSKIDIYDVALPKLTIFQIPVKYANKCVIYLFIALILPPNSDSMSLGGLYKSANSKCNRKRCMLYSFLKMLSIFHFPTTFVIENSDFKRAAFGTLLHVSYFNEGVHHKRLKVNPNFSGMLLPNCINIDMLPDPQPEHFLCICYLFCCQ